MASAISKVTDIDMVIKNIPNDKPLMQLFKRLIGNDSKQNTVLTNAQILDILQELSIEVVYIHDLEVEIYLNMIKKFLKDWPQWDEFDKTVNLMKTQGNVGAIEELLHIKYTNLKDYLKTILDMAKPLVKEALDKTLAEQNKDDNTLNVAMEINCTHTQLHQLFFRRPNPSYNNSIFNIINGPEKISVISSLPLKTIINWFHVAVEITCPSFTFKRAMAHVISHVLVNKKLNNVTESNEVLNVHPEHSNSSQKKLQHDTIIKAINTIVQNIPGNTNTNNLITMFFQQILSELQVNVQPHFQYIWYKQYMNKYPYVRYLYKDVNGDSDVTNKYDLQLQETVCPQYCYYIGKCHIMSPDELYGLTKWVKFSCVLCCKKFSGENMAQELRQHIIDYHIEQPNLRCCNCKKEFTILYLAENSWKHQC